LIIAQRTWGGAGFVRPSTGILSEPVSPSQAMRQSHAIHLLPGIARPITGRTTILAEAFLVRLEMLRRTAASNQTTGRSDTRFVPITPPREKDAAAVMDPK